MLGTLFILLVFFLPGGLAGLGAARRAGAACGCSSSVGSGARGGRPRRRVSADVCADERRRAASPTRSSGDGPPLLLMQGLGLRRAAAGGRSPRAARRALPRRDLRQPRLRRERRAARPVHGARSSPRDALAVLDAARVRARARARREPRRDGRAGARARGSRARRPARARVHDARRPGAFPMPAADGRADAEAAALAPEVALRRFVENALAPNATRELVERSSPTGASPTRPTRRLAARRPPRARRFDALGRLGEIARADARPPRHRRHRRRPRQRGAARRRGSRARGSSSSTGAATCFFWEQPERFADTRRGVPGMSGRLTLGPLARGPRAARRPTASRSTTTAASSTTASSTTRPTRFAATLADRGLERGDRVATLTGNTPEHVASSSPARRPG